MSILMIQKDGSRWWFNSKCEWHRSDGPAVECANGTKGWFLNGKPHRTDGADVEYSNGAKMWFLKGEEYTAEFKELINDIVNQSLRS